MPLGFTYSTSRPPINHRSIASRRILDTNGKDFIILRYLPSVVRYLLIPSPKACALPCDITQVVLFLTLLLLFFKLQTLNFLLALSFTSFSLINLPDRIFRFSALFPPACSPCLLRSLIKGRLGLNHVLPSATPTRRTGLDWVKNTPTRP